MGIEEEKAPSFVQKPKLRQEEDGDVIIFECVVVAYPKPDVIWYFNDKKIKRTQKINTEIKELSASRFYIALKLNEPEDDDSGLYKISVRNKKGDAIGSISANFRAVEEQDPDQQAPSFKKKPAIRQEEDGERLLFECIIVANPTPTISWFRDETPVVAKDRFKIKCDQKGQEYHCALVIDDVDEEDGGKYKVTAKNNLGESSATINLNFDTEEDEEEEGKPTFTGKPLIKQSPDFNSIIFECQLTADPKPTLHWFHNGKPLTEGGRYKSLLKVAGSGYLATLEIAEVGSADGGEYKVVAKNSAGDGFATINLNFEADKKFLSTKLAPKLYFWKLRL